MASSAPSKHKLGLPRDEEEMLMSLEQYFDDVAFLTEFGEKGLRALLVTVRDQKTFRKSFDELVSKGCNPDVLFGGLHYLLRSELQQRAFQLPNKREVRSLEATLRKAAKEILAFEKQYAWAHRVITVLWTPSSLTDGLLAHAEKLKSWWTPRSDALKSYGAIYNCAYAKLATGKPQFPLVADLNSSFLGRLIEPATLRKNMTRFEKRNRNVYNSMIEFMEYAHCLTSVEPVDWTELLGPKRDNSK